MCVCDRERFCQVLYDGCDGVFFCDNAVNLFSVAELRVCKSSLFSVYVFSFSAAQFFFTSFVRNKSYMGTRTNFYFNSILNASLLKCLNLLKCIVLL